MSWAEALIGALGGGAKSMSDHLKGEQELEDKRTLMKEQADLDLIKFQRAEQFKQQAANMARQQMTKDIDAQMPGLIGGAAQAAAQKQVAPQFAGARPANVSTWTPEQQASVDQARGLAVKEAEADPALQAKLAADPHMRSKAAMLAGYTDAAKTYADIGKGHLTVLGPGGIALDENNNVVGDNTGPFTARTQAAADKKATGKGMNPLTAQKIVDQMGSSVQLKPPPFVSSDEYVNGKPPADVTGQSVFKELYLRNVVAAGDETGANALAIKNSTLAQFNRLNDATTKKVNEIVGPAFDAKGKWVLDQKRTEKFAAEWGVDPQGKSPAALKNELRERALAEGLDALSGGSPAPSTSQAAPAPAPAAPTKTEASTKTAEAPKPAAAPAKPAPQEKDDSGKVIRPVLDKAAATVKPLFKGQLSAAEKRRQEEKRVWDEVQRERNASN